MTVIGALGRESVMATDSKRPIERRYCPECGYSLAVPKWNERTRCPECGGEFALSELTGLPPRGRLVRFLQSAAELAPGILRLTLVFAVVGGVLAFVVYCSVVSRAVAR
jgi:ribosomal protein S27AE